MERLNRAQGKMAGVQPCRRCTGVARRPQGDLLSDAGRQDDGREDPRHRTGIEVETPRELFTNPFYRGTSGPYDVTADGQRFL